jgi:hypothetical protein
MARKFLLCFHDFSVWNFQKVTPYLRDLRALAGAPFSVLVIPDTEKASEEAVDAFRKTLVELRNEGFELALHGYKHKAEFSQGRSYMGLFGMSVTHGEAEFAGLSEYESTRLLQAGLEAWDALLNPGLEPGDSGIVKPAAFVPPTWYSNRYLPMQVRGMKMLYEDRFSLTTVRGRRYASPVVSFAGIPDFLVQPAFKFGELMFRIPAGIPRIALHPVDFPERTEKVRDLVRTALHNRRKLVRYANL